MKRTCRPAHGGSVLLRHGRRSRAAQTCSPWLGAKPAPSDADHRSRARQARRRCARRQDRRRDARHPGDVLPERHGPVDHCPVQEKWITSKDATEAANYVSSGPFILDTWNHNSEIVLKPNPNWSGDVKPTLTEIHMSHDDRACPGPGGLRGRRARHGPAGPERGHPARQGRSDPRCRVKSSRSRARPSPTTTSTTARSRPSSRSQRCTDPKACPTMNKDFRIALTQAIDKKAFIDATYAGVGQPANSFVMPGIPGYDESSTRTRSTSTAAKAHMDDRPRGAGRTPARRTSAAEVRLQLRRGHEPRVAFLAEAWRTAFGLEPSRSAASSASSLPSGPPVYYDISRNGWGADYPHANNQLAASSSAAAATTTSSTATPTSTR